MIEDETMIQSVEPCPVEAAIQVIGGKWKLLVLRSLALNGPQRYNELLITVAGISQKELTRNLRELTGALLLARGSGGSRIARYELTKLGEGLLPTFQTLLTWGRQLLVSEKASSAHLGSLTGPARSAKNSPNDGKTLR
jgi:DNA-binding HxlR family transcriptional regulator